VISWPATKPNSVRDNLATADLLLTAIPPGSCDIVLFPEHFEAVGVYDPRTTRHVEEIDPQCTFGNHARRLGAIIAVPTIAGSDGNRRIMVTLVDENARSLGCYQKRHPWPCSGSLDHFEFGAIPGTTPAVLESPFGPLGVQVCFDVNYEVGWREIAESGAKLVLFPSAYPGGFGLRVRAWQVRAYVACSVIAGRPRIVGPDGGEFFDASMGGAVRIEPLNLNFCFAHRDHQGHLLRALVHTHPEVRLTGYSDDNVVKIEGPPWMGAIEDVLRQCGILTLRQYLDQAEQVIRSKASRDGGAGHPAGERGR